MAIYIIDGIYISQMITNDDEDKTELLGLLAIQFPSSLICELDILIPSHDIAHYEYSSELHTLVPRVIPYDAAVDRLDINAFRDQLDESPVTMDGHSFDADQLSLRKMTDVANFATNDQELTWTLADNTPYLFTGSAFKTIVDRVKKGQTKRSYHLHAHAKTLKEKLPDVFESELNKDLWPMDATLPGGVFCLDLPMR
jgi:hypothetical protein